MPKIFSYPKIQNATREIREINYVNIVAGIMSIVVSLDSQLQIQLLEYNDKSWLLGIGVILLLHELIFPLSSRIITILSGLSMIVSSCGLLLINQIIEININLGEIIKMEYVLSYKQKLSYVKNYIMQEGYKISEKKQIEIARTCSNKEEIREKIINHIENSWSNWFSSWGGIGQFVFDHKIIIGVTLLGTLVVSYIIAEKAVFNKLLDSFTATNERINYLQFSKKRI